MASRFGTLIFLALGAAAIAGGRAIAAEDSGKPLPAAGCALTRGADPRGGPAPLHRLQDARGPETTKPIHDGATLLRSVADIPLPGRPVRFDYQTGDTDASVLYFSHMSDDQILVFNTRTQQLVGRVVETPGVTGVWVVPELRKLYASVSGRHYVAVINTDSLTVRATPGPIGFPDGIAYVPEVRRIFVSDESGGGELVIDGETDQVVARIPLGGRAGNTKYDPGSGCVLVAVQTLNQIVAIDPGSAQVVGRYAPEGADYPHGLYVDAPDRLLFVANQGNSTLQVVALDTLQVTGTIEVGEDPDVIAFDPGWQRLYVATERGGLWVFRIISERRLAVEGVLDLPHAHTVSVDPMTHLVYLPLENVHGRPVLRVLSGVKPGAAGR